MNTVTLIGRVGRDPETRMFQDGSKVANFSMATSERWKDKQTGEKREHTDWHNVAVFGPTADVVERYVTKGSQIAVQGKLQTRKWQDQSGQDKYTTEVVLKGFGSKLELLGNGSGGQDQGAGQKSAGHQSGAYDDLDDEIPF